MVTPVTGTRKSTGQTDLQLGILGAQPADVAGRYRAMSVALFTDALTSI